MKNLITLLAAFLLTGGGLSAAQIFVLFDGTCGDRVEYEQSVARQPRAQYFAYQFGFEGGTRLILETGTEGGTVQNALPADYLYCDDPRLTPDLAQRVNAGIDRVFILLPTQDNQFLIQPVVMGATIERRGAAFTYRSPLAAYTFDTEDGIIGENLSLNGNSAKVYFEGRESTPCEGVFLFRQLNPGASYPVIDYKISPEIGVHERRLGSDGVTNSGGIIVAKTVNGVPVMEYLAARCQSNPLVTDSPTAYGNQQPAPPSPFQAYAQPESQAYAQASPAPAPTVTTKTHTVAKGETLYAVSRKYNTTVDAIKTQNGLTSNTLFPGQQLTVQTVTAAPIARVSQVNPQPTTGNGQPATGNGQRVTGNGQPATVPTMPYNAGTVANANPGAAQPVPYGATATPQAYNAPAQSARGGAAVYGEDVHIVQPGETVASVALKYGYTSAKFREMNELGPVQVLKVGQQLKTTSCNCPAPTPATATSAPAAYGQEAPAAPRSYGQPAAAPQAYGQSVPAAPQPYGQQPAAAPQPYGQAAQAPAAPAPVYRTPQGYQAPSSSPVPAASTPKGPEPVTINNNPNFGQVVPDVSAPPTATMGQLEQRVNRPTASDPSTYGAYAAPQPVTGNRQPATYNAPQPVPNPYGTPVGIDAPQQTQQPAARQFHLVQEGESLYSIARRYGLTTDQLRALNNLDGGGVIVPFQKLYVN